MRIVEARTPGAAAGGESGHSGGLVAKAPGGSYTFLRAFTPPDAFAKGSANYFLSQILT